ncbi:hypothetical protein J2S74_000872 [Evansella vedderi]|uniref:XRE family transcriptional regulator n=1 Tax=Evansella vedderi TaxID=38282 RepID=A0ABT9ZQI1_9BACI|nr:hypothetical protein [Evansella vedderi]MDQ0253500.1 hypothetical protein [Evansella vedderi]
MLDKKLLEELEEYIRFHTDVIVLESVKSSEYILADMSPIELEDFIEKNRQPTLKAVLFNYIDTKGASDSEIYKKAGIDRKHFSKIRSNPNYRLGKNTVIALAFALELNDDEMDKLLSSAGYSLSNSETADLIIQFHLEKKIYDLQLVNEALDYFSLKPLTGGGLK